MAPFFGIALLTLLVAVAWQDARHRRVPNVIVVAIAGLYGLAAAVSAVPLTPPTDLAVAAALLAAGMALWLPGWLGGGDVKLLAVLGLWAGPARAVDLVLAVAIAGGLLALFVVVLERLHRLPWATAGARPTAGPGQQPTDATLGARSASAAQAPTLPYAVAIAIGAPVALWNLFLT